MKKSTKKEIFQWVVILYFGIVFYFASVGYRLLRPCPECSAFGVVLLLFAPGMLLYGYWESLK